VNRQKPLHAPPGLRADRIDAHARLIGSKECQA
jgi:hypothetical protein